MKSHGEEHRSDTAPEQPQPAHAAPQTHRAQPPTKPALSLEDRVERLEKRLVAIIGEL